MTAAALDADTVSWLLAVSAPAGCCGATSTRPPRPRQAHILLNALIRHGVATAALRRLPQFPALHGLETALRDAHADNVRRALTGAQRLTEIAIALSAQNIDWCVLKGIPLALRHYGDVAARQVGDIDVLVAPHQTAAADRALRDTGWQRQGAENKPDLPPPRHWHEQRYVRPDGSTLELHHRLHPNPHLLAIPTDRLCAGAERVMLGEAAIPVLDATTELLYLSTHGCRHGWFRLMWVCDIAAVVTCAAPAALEDTRRAAHRLGLLQPLAQALRLANTLLGAAVPPWVAALHASSRRQRQLITFAIDTLWSARDAHGNPTQRARSSLFPALYQRAHLPFWAWELALRARHEHPRWFEAA